MQGTNQHSSSHDQASSGDDPQVQATTSTPQAGTEHSTPNEELLRQIKELRTENANHRAKAKEREQAAKDELDRQMQEQGKYKELADAHAERVRELEPIANRYEQLSDILTEHIKTTIKNWPDEVKSLLPGKDTPIELRYAQVEKLQALADRLTLQAQGQLPGNRPNPRPAQNMTPEETSQKALNELRSTGKYNM